MEKCNRAGGHHPAGLAKGQRACRTRGVQDVEKTLPERPRQRTRWLGWLLAAIVVPAVGAVEPAASIPVAAVTAVERIAVENLPATVRLPRADTVVVTAPLTGVVVDVLVGEGDVVQSGQALARLQSRDAMKLDADLAAARGDRRVAVAQAARDRQLFDEGIIAKARLETSVAARDAATARVAELEGVRRWAPTVPGHGPGVVELRAPIAGRVLQRALAPGDTYNALAKAFVIGRGERVLLELRVPSTLAGSIRRGQEVRTSGGFSARVTETGGVLDDASQTVLVRAEGDAGSLLPGMQTTATLWLPAPHGAVSLPAGALLGEGAQAHAFARTASGFRRVALQVVARDGPDRRVVVGQLQPGDAVATGAFDQLNARDQAGH